MRVESEAWRWVCFGKHGCIYTNNARLYDNVGLLIGQELHAAIGDGWELLQLDYVPGEIERNGAQPGEDADIRSGNGHPPNHVSETKLSP